MHTNLHCIALRTAKYSDRYSILSVYSREMGRLALLIPATAGKKASRYRALTMPLSMFECVATITSGRDVHPIRDLKPESESLKRDYNDPLKSTVSFFLAEFFASILREPVADVPVYELLRSTVEKLSQCSDKETANIHILTLVRTASVLGIEPDISTVREGSYFDMAEGVWRTDLSGVSSSCLLREKAVQAHLIARMNQNNFSKYKFNRNQRNETIDLIIKYFSLHGFGKPDLPALDILRDIFL